MSEPRGRYSTWLALTVVGIILLSGGAIYLLYGDMSGAAPEEIFGTPFASAATDAARDAARDQVRPSDDVPVRAGHMDSVAALAPVPAPAAPVDSSAAAASDATGAAGAAPDAPPRDVELEAARLHVEASEWPAAVAAYDALVRKRPRDTDLAHERARVLAWSGDPAAAAAALEPLLRADPDNTDLILERARFLWQAGDNQGAEAALTLALRIDPELADARALRRDVRQAMQPDVATARRWLEDDDTPAAHLRLARALARAGAHGLALSHYRVVTGTGETDAALWLEFASIARTADSAHVAVDIYRRLLAEREDPALRMERARAYAALDRGVEAQQDLRAVLRAEPGHGPALRLMGDLALWAGEWQRAIVYYRRAQSAAPDADAAPDFTAGLAANLAEAERMLARDRAAEAAPGPAAPVAPTGPLAWSVDSEAFGDSEEFRFVGTSVRTDWQRERHTLGLVLHQDLSRGLEAGQTSPRVDALGGELVARVAVADRIAVAIGGGARTYRDVGTFPTWLAGLEFFGDDDARVGLSYRREPALRRVATAASLQAEVTSDLLTATAGGSFGPWAASAELGAERLGSDLGDTDRFSGVATLQRPLGAGFSAFGSLSAITTSDASPFLEDWGNLYWSPEYYVAPGLGLSYYTPITDGWHAGVRVQPSYAFVRDRAGTEARFTDDVPFLGTGFEAVYTGSGWEAGLSADWSTALESDGYRAGAIRLRFASQPGWRP